MPQSPFSGQRRQLHWMDSCCNRPDFKGYVASTHIKCINSACSHLSPWIFNYNLKLFMPSRLAQWKLYFHKYKPAEEKADGSGTEVEGKKDLTTCPRFCSFLLHCLLLSLLWEKYYSILSHGATCAVSPWYNACIWRIATVLTLFSWVDICTKHENF